MSVILIRTDAIHDALQAAAHDSSLPQNVRQTADSLLQEDGEVPWLQLKHVLEAVRQGPASDQQGWLHEVCAGSGLVLRPPKARVRSPALQAHIASLQKRLEQRQYDAMVHDVTHAERAAAAAQECGLVTYKAQLSLGLHVLVMMFTFYAAGHVGTSYVSADPVHCLAGGLLGLVLALMMETLLLIIRTSTRPKLPLEEALRRDTAQGVKSGPTPCVGTCDTKKDSGNNTGQQSLAVDCAGMYKRQDWALLHGEHGGGVEDATSDEEATDHSELGEPQHPEDSESSDDDSRDSAEAHPVEDDEGELDDNDEPVAHRLEDLSEDDFDGSPDLSHEDAADEAAAQEMLLEQMGDWLDTSKEEHTKGRPLMCLACKGVLLLNAQSLRLHLASKRHSRLLKGFPQESVGPVCFATKARSASPDAETHKERGARIAKEAAALQARPAILKVGKRKRGAKRKSTKPGKRQRLLARMTKS